MASPPEISISVVIPALNEQPAIADALATARADGVERILADGGSSDATVAIALEHGVEQVVRCEPGRARQMAAGSRAASGQALLFLHADTRLEPGWADALRAALADARVAGGAFRLRFASERRVFRALELGVRLRCRIGGLPYGDQALFVRRAVLERCGGIPPVPIFEDLDLARAIRRAGRLALLPQLATTSPRRYLRHGVARLVLRNLLALGGYLLGLDRERVARWYRGRSPA